MADVKRYTFRENGQPWMKYAILLPDDSIQYVRAEDYDSLRASHSELLNELKDMVTIARFDDWEDATTGRSVVVKSAKAAIAKAEGVCYVTDCKT